MILVAGLPASGKSTFAKSLSGRVLEFDSLAEKLGSYEEVKEENDFALKYFVKLAGSGLYSVVVDVFNTFYSRAKVLEVCPCSKIIVVDTPLELCLKRNLIRKTYVTNEEIVSIANNFQPITPDEGFYSIEVVNGY